MRCSDPDSDDGCTYNRSSSCSFCSKPMHRTKLGNLVSHSFDDTPSSGKSAECDRGMGSKDHPQRNWQVIWIRTNAEVSDREQEWDNYSHRFLGVICSVAETIRGCRKELKPLEMIFSNLLVCLSREIKNNCHENESAGKTNYRRYDHECCYQL